MTTEQSELARRRLWLGITNVGFWVLTTAVGLYWLTCYDTSGFNLRRLGFTFAAAVAVQAVFDFIERLVKFNGAAQGLILDVFAK